MSSETSESSTILEVQGMTCPSCVRHVTAALKALAGVETIDVKLREGLVIVTHAPTASASELVDALGEAGYPSRATAPLAR